MTFSVSVNGAAAMADLTRIGSLAFIQADRVIAKSGKEIETLWKANASQTSGAHGKRYPPSIRYTKTAPLEATIRPTPGMRQAAMSFEYGSRNQPAHLDGERALLQVQPLLRMRLERALRF